MQARRKGEQEKQNEKGEEETDVVTFSDERTQSFKEPSKRLLDDDSPLKSRSP